MESRILEITLQYAKDLNKVNFFTPTEAYVVVSLSGNNNCNQKIKTPTDHHGDANPTWNFPMKFTLDETGLHHNLLTLDFLIVCQRVLGDKDIGQVHVSVKELFDYSKNSDGMTFITYQVRKPSGKSKGHLTFSYRFRDKIVDTGPTQPYTEEVPLPPPCGNYHEAVVGGGGYLPPPVQGYIHWHGGTPMAGYPSPSPYEHGYLMTPSHSGYNGHDYSMTPSHSGYNGHGYSMTPSHSGYNGHGYSMTPSHSGYNGHGYSMTPSHSGYNGHGYSMTPSHSGYNGHDYSMTPSHSGYNGHGYSMTPSHSGYNEHGYSMTPSHSGYNGHGYSTPSHVARYDYPPTITTPKYN